MTCFTLIWVQYDSVCTRAFNTFEQLVNDVIRMWGETSFPYCKFIDKDNKIVFMGLKNEN